MKVRTFVLNDTINARRIKKLIQDIEECKAKIVNVHLCSDGGYVDYANIFIDFTHRTDKKINFIGNGRMMSACVHIFLEAKGKKSLYPYTNAMLHLASVDPESRDLLNKTSFASIQLKAVKKYTEEMLNKYINVFDLSSKEISILKNGGDLGLDYERLKKALPKINK